MDEDSMHKTASGRRRYSFVLDEEPRQETIPCIVQTILYLHKPLIKYQQALERFGFFVERHPKAVILVCIVFMSIGCLGLLRMRGSHLSNDSFYPSNSLSKQQLESLKKFETTVSRREEIIFLPVEGSNILKQECLREALMIHNSIRNITNYQTLCTRSKSTTPCIMINVFELFQFDLKMVQNFSAVLRRELKRDKAQLMSNGRTLPFLKNTIFSELKMVPGSKGGNDDFSAKSMKIVYFLKQPKNKTSITLVNQWEHQFISDLISLNETTLKCSSILCVSQYDKEDVISTIFTPQSLTLYISTFSLLFVIFLVSLVFAGKGGAILLAAGTLCIGLILTSSVSISYAFGFSFSNSTIVILIFLGGKGFADILLVVFELEHLMNVSSLKHRIASCAAKVGLIATTTICFDVVVFGITQLTSLPGIKEAYLVALIAIPLQFFFFLPFLLGCSFLLLQHFSHLFDQKNIFTLCMNSKQTENHGDEGQRVFHGTFRLFEKYAQLFTRRLNRLFVVILTVGIIVACIYIQRRNTLNYQDHTELLQSSRIVRYKNQDLKYFGQDVHVNLILSGAEVDYKMPQTQNNINTFTKKLSLKSYSTGNMISWLTELLNWSKRNGIACQRDKFPSCLQRFLAVPENALFKQDIIFAIENNYRIINLSRLHFFMKLKGNLKYDIEQLRSFRKDIQALSEERLTTMEAVSERFLLLDMIDVLKSESFIILIVAGIAILLCPLFLTASLRIGILLAASFILHIEELITMMEIWNIPLNPVTFYCLFIGLLWASHLSIQMLQVRAVATESTVQMRTVAVLRSVGPGILISSIISISSSISLSFLFPSLSTIFLFVLPVLFLLALFHSLALLPVIILISSKPAENLMKYLAIDLTAPDVQDPEGMTEKEHLKVWYEKQQSTISIIGISCRFPQAGSKERFFELLSNKTCVVTHFPSSRPEEYELFQELYHPKRFVKCRICTTGGAFLENIRGFDAEFFKISPQEAPAMDPQQRILLQVVYEAIEDAGLRLEDLQMCKTGVFVGVMNLDYGTRIMDPTNRVNMDQFYSTGSTSSIVANRISFCLNLTGPSLSVDTACSSSLTALNIAQCCLTSGQCDVAIVCAPNIILDAAVQMTFSIGGLLAPDGRCKCFDTAADGYGRGEGFAAVILKPTLVSMADNDDIYCEILACGMNNDGQNSTPITAPSPKTQSELSKSVLEESGLSASSIEYVEAHGTGTAIGDVVETTSIANTYCDKNALKQRILRIGSVKSNLNHTESASGLAGLIKVALMIKNGVFLPTANIRSLNPKLKLSDKGMIIQQSYEKWKANDEGRRTAAINSFGYGGSNVHAILQEVQSRHQFKEYIKYEADTDKYILTLSAKSDEALRHLAKRFVLWLKEQPDEPEFKLNLCYSLTERRSHHDCRLSLVFQDIEEATASLKAFANSKNDVRVVHGLSGSTRQNILFVFGGQGANWEGMGKDMIDSEPQFREHIYEIDKLLSDLGVDWSLLNEIRHPDIKRITGNIVGQPACFAIQYATYKLLESWGMYPSAVVGHSLGEVTAACCCGALSLKEALQLVLLRSKWHERCSSEGLMAALGMPEDRAKKLIIDLKLENTVCIAAINDQNNVTVSGNKDSVECIGNHLKSHNPNVFWKTLSAARAFHSMYLNPVKTPCCTELEALNLKPKLMRIPLYSTVYGDEVLPKQLEGQHWWKNMRECVQFYHSIRQAFKDGNNMAMEISPQPVLSHYIRNIQTNSSKESSSKPPISFSTFPRQREPEQHREFLKNTVCQLYTIGYPIYWSAMYGCGPRKLVRFPTYPWNEKEYWYREKPPPKPIRALKASESTIKKTHPFLKDAQQTEQFCGVMCWESEVDLHRFPTFKDHVLTQGGPVLPGSACVEMAIAMATERFQQSQGVEVRDVRFTNLLTLPESQVRALRLRLEMKANNTEGGFSVCNVQDDGTEMVLAKGNIFVESSRSLPSVRINSSQTEDTQAKRLSEGQVMNEALQEVISNMAEVPLSTFRHLTEKLGFDFGPCYCLIKQIWRKENNAVCMLEMDGPFVAEIPEYVIHPAFVDACFQTAVACEDDDGQDRVTVPISVKSFLVIDPDIPRTTYCYVTKTASGDTLTYDMRLVDSFGKVYITIKQFQSAEVTNLIRSPKLHEIAYQINWVESQVEDTIADLTNCIVIVMMDSKGIGISFAECFSQMSKTKITMVKLPQDSKCDDLTIHLKTLLPKAELYSRIVIVNFWPVETSYPSSCIESIDQYKDLSFMSSLHSMKFLADVQSSININCKLVVVTRCTQFVSGEKDAMIPWASSAWGLCRTARLEFQGIRTINVDLSTANEREIQQLVHEVKAEYLDDEIVLRGNKRYVNRLIRSTPGSRPITSEESVHSNLLSNPVCLASHPNTGQVCLRRLTKSFWTSPDIIEVTVNNIWIPEDISMRLHSTNSFIGYSGSVSQTPGQSVCGITRSNRLGNTLHVKENEVIKRPVELSHHQAASLASCLPLAYHALGQATDITSDEHEGSTVIIHEANRDLGLAGLLVAKALGYSVICTTSEPHFEVSKRRLLELGAWLVSDAYLSDLADFHSFREAEAALFFYDPLPKSIRNSSQLLKTGGKIVLLGELRNSHVVMPSNKSISCQQIDYKDILDTPGRYRELWTSCWQLLKSKDALKTILQIDKQETSIFDAISASGTSMRKPTLSFSSVSFNAGDKSSGSDTVQLLPVGVDQYKLKQDRAYMVIGGVRGFGFEVARWMAYNGAGTVVLLARSPPSESKLQEILSIEKKTGSKIITFQTDVSNPIQMKELSSNELTQLPSIAGIVLTAMVLRDQLIPQVDQEVFSQVMAPKIKGAYIVHQMSLSMDLDFFVMFSSIASLLGNPGQAAYSAANAFLDSFACYRRRVLGLPALSVNWGPIKGAGVLQRQENVAALLSQAGYRLLDAKQAIEFLGQFLVKEPLAPEIGLFDADWSRLLEASQGLSKSTRFEAIKEELESLQTEKDLSLLGPKILMESDNTKKQVMVEEFVTELIASWFDVSELDLKTSLYSHGLDSFFALTLKMQLEASLQVSFEVFYFMQPDTTPSKIVEDILAKLRSKQQENLETVDTNLPQPETSENNEQGSQSTRKASESVAWEYPKDTSCPTATYQVMPLYAPQGANIMFFCVHPAGRYAMNLVPISTAFKSQSLISFYAIGYTDPTMTGDTRSVRELARSYVGMIKQLQRHGPYFLGGQSFGGLIAFEMASLLLEEEEDVAFVAMIDTFPWEISNRSASARLEILFGGTKLEQLVERLFQATFEQILSKLATQTLKMTNEEYDAKRATVTQDGIIEFLEERGKELQIPLYDIKVLRESLHQDNDIASRKHREWKPAAVCYPGPLTFLKSANQRFTPLRPLQESSDEAWSLVVDGNVDVYMCPGDHLALSESSDAFITGGILVSAIGVTYRRRFGLLKNVQRPYMQNKAIQKFALGVDMFLHSRKGSKLPKYGKLYLEENKSRIVFRTTATTLVKNKGKHDSQKRKDTSIDLTDLSNVLPGKHIRRASEIIGKPREVRGYLTGNLKNVVSIVISNHRVYNFELLNLSDLKAMYQMLEAVLSVSLTQHMP